MKMNNAAMRGLSKKVNGGSMDVKSTPATHAGIGFKSLYFGLITVVTLVTSYVLFYKFLGVGNEEALSVLLLLAGLSGLPMFILSLVISFAPGTVKVCGTLYCILQGLFLSVLVALVDLALPGVSLAAVLGTAVLVVVALLFSRVLGAKVSSKLTLGLMTVVCTLALTEGILWILSLCGVYAFGALWWIQLIACGVCIIWGTVMLMADFQTAENMVNRGVDKKFEWNVGFAIITTVVYVYINVLELIIRLMLIFGRHND